MVQEDPNRATASSNPAEEIRAALLRLLDLVAEKVAQEILRELEAKERHANGTATSACRRARPPAHPSRGALNECRRSPPAARQL
jgi:hypothetical protein